MPILIVKNLKRECGECAALKHIDFLGGQLEEQQKTNAVLRIDKIRAESFLLNEIHRRLVGELAIPAFGEKRELEWLIEQIMLKMERNAKHIADQLLNERETRRKSWQKTATGLLSALDTAVPFTVNKEWMEMRDTLLYLLEDIKAEIKREEGATTCTEED